MRSFKDGSSACAAFWHPLPPNPHPNHTPPPTLRLESYCPQLVQAAFCPSFPSSSLHFYCQALLSLGFLCFAFPVVRILPCKGAPGSGSKTPSQLLFQKRHALPPPQVTIPGLTDVSHPAGEKAAGGKLSFPFQPSAPTPPSRKAAQPLLLLHLKWFHGGWGGGRVPSSAPSYLLDRNYYSEFGILWNLNRISIFISIFSFFLSKALFSPATIFLGDCT